MDSVQPPLLRHLDPSPDGLSTSQTSRHQTTIAEENDDPEEVDISSLPRDSHGSDQFVRHRNAMQNMMGNTPQGMDENDVNDPLGILQQLRSMQAGRGQPEIDPFAMLQKMQQSADRGGSGSADDAGADPMAIMNQMMGAGAGRGASSGFPNLQSAGKPPSMADARTRLWNVIHFASMLLILLFLEPASFPITTTTTTANPHRGQSGQPVFWWFITIELLLQSTRLFLYGPTTQSGIVSQIAQFLPPPYSTYLALLSRYTLIFTTLRDDFWVLLFGMAISSSFRA